MSELKATPGPWMVLASVWQPQFCVLTEGGRREDICRTYGFPPTNEANAHLIASAPDLYAAATRALNFIENTESELGITLDSGDALRTALACARGDVR